MNDKNIEQQLARIADSLESLVNIMRRAESLAQNVVASQRMGSYGQKDKDSGDKLKGEKIIWLIRCHDMSRR